MSLPTLTFRRATSCPHNTTTLTTHQIRHASLYRRPHRPYTFTQLITLSDGSVYTHRTTSPAAIYKSAKDTRNHIMWNPSLTSLRNVEEDEAGRLKAFREKFGRGWDIDGGESEREEFDEGSVGEFGDGDGGVVDGEKGERERRAQQEEDAGSLMDLMSSAYAGMQKQDMTGRVQGADKEKAKPKGKAKTKPKK